MSSAFGACGQQDGSSQLLSASPGFVVRRASLHLWLSGGDARQAARGWLLFFFPSSFGGDISGNI